MLVIFGSCYGQNWEPFTLGETHHFSSDASNFPDRSIRVDSVRGNLADSVWHFNRVFEEYNNDTSYVNRAQFCERSLRVHPNGHYQFFDPGNIAVYSLANMGATWLLDSTQNLTGTVVGIYADSVLGEPDSLKVIEITGGDSLILSKLHGLVKWPDTLGPQAYTLVGIQERHLGDTLPGFDGFFKYKAGDEYYWDSRYYQGDQPPIFTQNDIRTKMTIDSARRDSVGLHVFTSLVQRWYYQGNSTGFGQVHTHAFIIRDTMGLVNRTHNEAFRFEDCLLPYDFDNAFRWAETGPAGNRWNHGLYEAWTSNQYSRSNDTTYLKIGPEGGNGVLVFFDIGFPAVSSTVNWVTQEVELTEGLGVTNVRWQDFETSANYRMVGHIIDDDTVGTTWTESYLLGLEDDVFATQWQVFPNPAKDQANIVIDSDEQATMRIMSLTGQELMRKSIENGKAIFDVDAFPAGLYLVELQIGAQRDFQKLLIE